MAKKLTLLGSTGSIGTQSLDVARAQGYEVYALAANSNVDLLLNMQMLKDDSGFHSGMERM